jgi:hypothetical protein
MQPFLLPEVVLGATAMSQDDFEELMPSRGEMMRNVMKYGKIWRTEMKAMHLLDQIGSMSYNF